ncbi:MAG: hypothetical protein ABW124_20335 [Candidatus Thiodiazotropha sp. 6PLUC9]
MSLNKLHNKWKWAFLTSVALSFVAIVFLLYAVIDQGVTITYMSQGYSDSEKDLQRLAAVFPKEAYSKKDLVYLLRRENPDAIIVDSKCAVQLRGLRFEFSENGKLININTKAESSPEYECGDR